VDHRKIGLAAYDFCHLDQDGVGFFSPASMVDQQQGLLHRSLQWHRITRFQ
jgi:hypothetical protein